MYMCLKDSRWDPQKSSVRTGWCNRVTLESYIQEIKCRRDQFILNSPTPSHLRWFFLGRYTYRSKIQGLRFWTLKRVWSPTDQTRGRGIDHSKVRYECPSAPVYGVRCHGCPRSCFDTVLVLSGSEVYGSLPCRVRWPRLRLRSSPDHRRRPFQTGGPTDVLNSLGVKTEPSRLLEKTPVVGSSLHHPPYTPPPSVRSRSTTPYIWL